MAASASDYFTEVGNPGTATTLDTPGHLIGGSTFPVISTANWPTTTGAIFAVDVYDNTTGKRVPGTYTEWEAVVASSTVLSGAVLRYGTDQNYPAGATTRVYVPVASSRENRLVQGLLLYLLNQDGTIKNNAITSAAQITDGIIGDAEMSTSVKPVTIANENMFDHVVSGCVWTADAVGSTRNASMTSGVVMIAGKRLTVAAVVAHSFSASKDVYVGLVDAGDGTATVIYYDNTTNGASPSLATALYTMLIGIVVVGASSIATAAAINQGQETSVLPIVSSVPYAVTDSLGNLICPRDPNRRIIGYRQITTSIAGVSTSNTPTQITGLSVPVIVPAGRRATATVHVPEYATNAATTPITTIWDGVVNSGTKVAGYDTATLNASGYFGGASPVSAPMLLNASVATSKTYNAGIQNTAAATLAINVASQAPAFIKVILE